MKKHFYILFIVFLLWNFSFAQTFSIGIKTGVSHTGITGRFNYKSFTESQISYNNIKAFGQSTSGSKINSSGLVKLTSGFILNYQVAENISLQSELNYEEKGFDFHCIRFGKSVYGNYKMHYLSIPFSLTCESGQTVKYYGYWGISLNVLLKARNYTFFTGPGSAPSGIISYSEFYKPDELNKKELSALAGIGIKIPLSGKIKFIVDARYNSGITKAAKNTDQGIYFHPAMEPNGTPNNFQKVFNRSVTLCWGVIYKISKGDNHSK